MPRVSDELVAFLHGGLSFLGASRDAELRPWIAKVLAVRIAPDGASCTAFVADAASEALLRVAVPGAPALAAELIAGASAEADEFEDRWRLVNASMTAAANADIDAWLAELALKEERWMLRATALSALSQRKAPASGAVPASFASVVRASSAWVARVSSASPARDRLASTRKPRTARSEHDVARLFLPRFARAPTLRAASRRSDGDGGALAV